MQYSSVVIGENLLCGFRNQLKTTGEDTVSGEVARFWFHRFNNGNWH